MEGRGQLPPQGGSQGVRSTPPAFPSPPEAPTGKARGMEGVRHCEWFCALQTSLRMWFAFPSISMVCLILIF